MIQHLQQSPRPEAHAATSPRLWGLTPRELHDAYWHGRGVQCVRRGESADLQPAAELYMLLEPTWLVMFDLGELCERLTWHDAAVTRVRLVDEAEQPYSEHVLLDDRGLVRCVERRYVRRLHASHRVVLTPSRRIARLWQAAASRREGWNRVRRSVSWTRVDHARGAGRAFREGDAVKERELLDELVERWPNPSQSITGLEQAEPGVWHVAAQPLEQDVVRIGPYWVGLGEEHATLAAVVGPTWSGDAGAPEGAPGIDVTVRPIVEVELADDGRRAAPVGRRAYAIVKRAMDVGASFAALLLLGPSMLLIALLIWLEDGRPIFFKHRRQGRHGRAFDCLKFRTMHPDAEKIASDLEAYNVCDGPQVYIQDDPRVTRLGKVLRRMHLDELPQLINVLRGQMSLVGPRPSPDGENQYCPAWRDMRLSVRPGITGLWQLNRTREPGEDFQEWIKYDIEYVSRASLWLDLSIIVRTAWLLVMGRFENASE